MIEYTKDIDDACVLRCEIVLFIQKICVLCPYICQVVDFHFMYVFVEIYTSCIYIYIYACICIYIYIYNASYIPIQAYVDIQTLQICIVIYLRTNLHNYIQFLIRMAHTRAYIYIRTYIPVAGQEEIGTTIDLSILRGTEKLDFILWHMSAQMVCMYVCMYAVWHLLIDCLCIVRGYMRETVCLLQRGHEYVITYRCGNMHAVVPYVLPSLNISKSMYDGQMHFLWNGTAKAIYKSIAHQVFVWLCEYNFSHCVSIWHGRLSHLRMHRTPSLCMIMRIQLLSLCEYMAR
jgi:hypothetical protein